MDLRDVLRALNTKGEKRATVKEKRALALQAMQHQDIGDVDLETVVDEAAIKAGNVGSTLMASTQGRVLHVVPGGSSSAANPSIHDCLLGWGPMVGQLATPCRSILLTRLGIDAISGARGADIGATHRVSGAQADVSDGSTGDSGGAGSSPGNWATRASLPLVTPSRSNGAGAREMDFSAIDVARLVHVLSDPANGDALRRASQALSRAELEKGRVSLLNSVVGPILNRASYRPTPPELIAGIMETDLRGMDPNRHSGARLASKLEGHFRTLRSLYTVAFSNYTRSGQNEPVFKSFAQGDHRLRYIHCLLKCTDATDFILRTIPAAVQSVAGLPGSERVGCTTSKPPKRAKVAQVAIDGIDGLTSAISGVVLAMAPTSATATDASDKV